MINNPLNLPEADLEEVFVALIDDWEKLRNQNVFITGGTGFIGKWLIATLFYADHKLDLNTNIYALTRSPKDFCEKFPVLLKYKKLHLIECDIRHFNKIETPFCSFGIHAALDVEKKVSNRQIVDTAFNGTSNFLLNFLNDEQKVTQSMLLISSGAVYGENFAYSGLISETDTRAPSPAIPKSAYGEGKRLSELLCSIAHEDNKQLNCAIARCFAFVGPCLPLKKHFAIGNFISDVLEGKDIQIKGDGTPIRSYLYASELAVSLWKLLLKVQGINTYNIGGKEQVSIEQLAKVVVSVMSGKNSIEVLEKKHAPTSASMYVPNISKFKTDFHWEPTISLEEAIKRTAEWAVRSGEINVGG